MKKKILILGGLGFIGYHLSRALSLNNENQITIVDDNSRGKLDDYASKLIKKKNIKFLRLNLTKFISYQKLKSNYDHVYLLASIVGVNNTLSFPLKVIEANSYIILNTLKWIKSKKIKKFMFASTSEAYAGTIDSFKYKIPTPEDIPLAISDIGHPRYTYAITKMLGESAFLNLKNNKNLKVIIVRFHNIYGERMGFKHVIPHLIERFYKKERPFTIYGGKQTRAFCYVEDAVSQITKLMNKKNNKNKIYNIGNDQEVTIKKISKIIGKKFNFKSKYIYEKSFPGSTKRRCPDISRIKNELKLKPKINLDKGLSRTIKWYLDYFSKNKKFFERSFQKPSSFKNV